ncbi:unnamed protein product, partial [Tenebrio molitor]
AILYVKGKKRLKYCIHRCSYRNIIQSSVCHIYLRYSQLV